MENNIDTSHNPILHYGAVSPENDPGDHGPDNAYMTANRAPHFIVMDTEAGSSYGCYRAIGDGKVYWRTMHWLFPFYTMSPRHPLGSLAGFVATVPIDDHHYISWSMNRPVGAGDPTSRGGGGGRTLPNTSDWLGRFRSSLDPSTDFGLDRELQKAKPPNIQGFTGLRDIGVQDTAMQWSQGRPDGGIVNRNREHLGTTDMGIIRVRRRLLDAAKALQHDGAVPPGVDQPEAYRLRSGWTVLPGEVNWWEATRAQREAFRMEKVAISLST
jgi:hypothetical protein